MMYGIKRFVVFRAEEDISRALLMFACVRIRPYGIEISAKLQNNCGKLCCAK